MIEVLNFPIKLGKNLIEEYNCFSAEENFQNGFFLIVIKHTEDFEYSVSEHFLKKFRTNFPDVDIENFYCNFKYAAVKAGLGQYGKNSLFYHPSFQFDTHLAAFFIANAKLIAEPKKEADFNYLNLCKNCNECINACPVQAIHNNNFSWVNTEKCDNFCFYGNHPKIPTGKYNAVKIQNINISDEQLKAISNYKDFYDVTGQNLMTVSYEENNKFYVQYPICRECTSQRCTKYKGNYPYDKNNVKILKLD